MTDLINPSTLGWLITAVIGLVAAVSSGAKLLNSAAMREKWNERLQLPNALRVWAGGLELLAAVLFVAAPTAIVGGVLLTVYLGAAIAVHLRVGVNAFTSYGSIVIALIWVAIWLRLG